MTIRLQFTLACLLILAFSRQPLPAQPPVPQRTEPAEFAPPLKKLYQKATPLNPQQTLFLDRPGKAIYLKTHVCLQEGLLEMLCCPVQTKEHESILAVNSGALPIHTALLALGAEPGQPVQFEPEFQAPQGEKLEIKLFWIGEDGKVQETDAREWVRTITRRYFVAPLKKLPEGVEFGEDSPLVYDEKRKELLHFNTMSKAREKEFLELSDDEDFRKAIQTLQKKSQPSTLDADWVFAGSIIEQDESGNKRYLADGGDLICVANFPSAMIDIAIRSSASNDQRSFEANSDAVPALGTPVLIRLMREKDVEKSGKEAKQ